MNNTKLIEKAESLQNLLISRATGGEAHDIQNKTYRDELMDDQIINSSLYIYFLNCYLLS